jgi:hypothetical protein
MFGTHRDCCPEFLAGDHTRLRELLHPAKADLKLGYSLAHGFLDPGKQSLWHRLTSSEVYYFIAGCGLMKVDEESMPVEAGSVIYVPPWCQAGPAEYRNESDRISLSRRSRVEGGRRGGR